MPTDDAAPLSPTPRYRDVLRRAEDQARRHGHHHLGVEHLLLGILDSGRSVATGVLERRLDLGELREAIEQFLASEGYRAAPDRPPVTRTTVTLVRGDEREQATLHRSVPGPHETRTLLEWSGRPVRAAGGDLFEALVRIREQLEPQGWFIAVHGSRLDAVRQDDSDGLHVHITRIGEPVTPANVVETLADADPRDLATVDAQREHVEAWRESLHQER